MISTFQLRSLSISLAVTAGMFALPLSASAADAYVTNSDDDSISVIDTYTDALTATVMVGNAPYGVAVSGTGVYVTNSADGTVTVIDRTDNVVVTTVTVGSTPIGIVINGTGAYVANAGGGTVSLIDITTNTVERTISVGDGPQEIAISGTGAYVGNSGAGTVSVIDLARNTVAATVTVGDQPLGIAASGTGVYVANTGDDTVTVIDRTDNVVVTTIAVGSGPQDVGISGTGAYVPNYGDNNLSIIDTTTNTVERTITLGENPRHIAITGTKAYVPNDSDNNVSVINLSTNIVTTSVTVGARPYDVAIGSDITPPSAPTGFTAEADGYDVTLTWTNPTESDYAAFSIITAVDDYPDSILDVGAVLSGASETTWTYETDDELTYFYSIFAVDSTGNVSQPAHATVRVDVTAPSTLSAFNALASEDDVRLSWSTSDDPYFDEFMIRRSDTAYPSSVSDGALVMEGGGTSYIDSNLPDGTYYYAIFVKDESSNYSSPTTTTIVVDVPSTGNSRGSGEGRAATTVRKENPPAETISSPVRSPITVKTKNGTQIFTDVFANDWFGPYVKKLVELNIFGGYADKDGKPMNLYGPGDSITLGQLAKVATILRNGEDLDPKPSGDEWFKPYIGAVQAYDASVFTGDFDPLAQATRGQVIHTIMEGLGIPLTKIGVAYSDVPENHPYMQAIATASSLGIVSGDENKDTFRPNDPVNRAEVAKMVTLALQHAK